MNLKKIFAVITLMTASSLSFGQAISQNGGSIQGTITDPSGAIVPGATIIITEPATGYSRTLTADKSGFYSLGPLVPGSYTINITAPNFQKLSVTTVVRTGTVTSGNEKLTLGSTTETVEVTASELQVNTDQIAVAGVVTREQIESLPINGRNILDVAQIQPGVILQQGQSFDPTKAGYDAISVGGVSGRTTRILLDGQDITDETVGTTIFNVPTGAVDEFQLNQSTQDISGEVTSTGQVLVSTQSGTNIFHGNLFYNFQDARAGFADVNGVAAPFQRNQFGGYVGGPIIKDKLFFFGGAERIKQTESTAVQGDPLFSDPTQIAGDPYLTTPILTQYPFLPTPFRDTYSTARLDYNAPRGIHLFARASYSVNYDDATFGLSPYSVYGNRDNVPAIVGGADFTTGKFTHSFRGGYEKFHNILGDGTGALGASIYNPSTGPNNQISLVGSFDAGPNYLAPQGTFQSDKQFRYDGTWTKGRNSFKFGGEMNRILNGGFAEFYGASLYTAFSASPGYETNCGGQATLGTCAGDPTHGYLAAAYVIGNGNGLFSERPGFGLPGGGDPSWRFAAYAGDTYKASQSISIVAGLRWSVDTDRANQDLPTPLCSSVDPSLQFTGCTGNTPLFDQYQVGLGVKTHQPYANFGPQLGVVFSPGDHKTSYRIGGGIYYESDIFNNTGNSRTESIQTPGAYFNYGVIGAGGSSIYLPGFGSVSAVNGTSGVPCTTPGTAGCVSLATVTLEPISQAGPIMNGLKAAYQAKVQGVASANPSYIGTGDALYANAIYAGPYKTPYSIQYNGGIQRELRKGTIISANYLHNSTLKVPLTIDVNHVGAARTFNVAAAQNAVTHTTAALGCTGGYTAAAINCAITANVAANVAAGNGPINTLLTSLSGNGLDSSTTAFGGAYPASAVGLTPATGAAFPGTNANVGGGDFILPIGRSGYDALQVVLQQQKQHPLPGIVNSNFQVSYNLSRVVSSAGGNSDQFFAGQHPFDNDNPNLYIGRNAIDHTNELSFGGAVGVGVPKFKMEVGFVGHFFSAPPTTLTLDNSNGNTQSAGQIFQSDLDGDGSIGDLVPGTNPGAYMHEVKGAGLNKLISNYNATHAGQLTPAGQQLVSSGLFTPGQLAAIGAVQGPLALAPTVPLPNSATREFDVNASYPIGYFSRYHTGLTIVPGVQVFNVFNLSNFASAPTGQLLNAGDSGCALTSTACLGTTNVGYLNGPNTQAVLNSGRIERGSGTFDQGAPRTMEFDLKIKF